MLEFTESDHVYKFDGRIVPSVSNIIAPYSDFSKIPAHILSDKQKWGNSVHLYLEEYDKGTLDYDGIEDELDPEAPDIKKVVLEWDKFIDPFIEKHDTTTQD